MFSKIFVQKVRLKIFAVTWRLGWLARCRVRGSSLGECLLGLAAVS